MRNAQLSSMVSGACTAPLDHAKICRHYTRPSTCSACTGASHASLMQPAHLLAGFCGRRRSLSLRWPHELQCASGRALRSHTVPGVMHAWLDHFSTCAATHSSRTGHSTCSACTDDSHAPLMQPAHLLAGLLAGLRAGRRSLSLRWPHELRCASGWALSSHAWFQASCTPGWTTSLHVRRLTATKQGTARAARALTIPMHL